MASLHLVQHKYLGLSPFIQIFVYIQTNGRSKIRNGDDYKDNLHVKEESSHCFSAAPYHDVPCRSIEIFKRTKVTEKNAAHHSILILSFFKNNIVQKGKTPRSSNRLSNLTAMPQFGTEIEV